uniref:Protein kinase domain-containing protein n=1 Tax=Angiostrongylus cantonensis TaxID=6313 RepID=A0A0K0D826_ANGCA
SRDLISFSNKPSPTKASTHLTIQFPNAQNGQRRKGSYLMKNSLDSAKHAVALEAATAAANSTTTSSAGRSSLIEPVSFYGLENFNQENALCGILCILLSCIPFASICRFSASYSVLMKKVELPRGLPERWKQLVLQLKKKLEALKERNSLLNHTLTMSPPPTQPPSTHPDAPEDENAETDKPIRLSARHFADPLSSSRQQLLEGIFTTGDEINKVVGKPSTTTLGTRFLSSTLKTTASSASFIDGIVSEAKEATGTDNRRAQSEEPKSGTISSTVTITNLADNYSKSLGSSIAKNSSLSELVTLTAVIHNSNQPFKDVKMLTDSVISKETSSDKSALNPSLNSKITSTEANVKTPTQIQFLAEDLMTNTSLLTPQSRTRIIQHSASKDVTEASFDSKKSSDLSIIKNFVNPMASLRNTTASTTRIPELTSSGTGDVESVGGFVISKEDTSSEELLEPSGQRESVHGKCYE